MSARTRHRATGWLLLSLLAACDRAPAGGGRGLDTAGRPQGRPAAADADPSFVHCTRAAPPADGGSPPTVLGGVELVTRSAGRLEARELRGGAGDGRGRGARLRLGVLSDTREALPQTLTNVARLVARFRAARVDAVVMLGGLDSSFVGAVRLLRALRGPWALLALAGDRSSAEGFQAALRHADPAAIDLTRTQIVAWPTLTLVGVPGYHLPHHNLAGPQGCGYDAADLTLLTARLRGTALPRLLLAHGPPRGQGPHAVDRASGEVNVGDPLLRRWIDEAQVRFGVFGHVHEAAGQATRLDGSPVAPGLWSDSLLLQVGSSEAVPHQQRTGDWSTGTAAVLELDGSRARYTMITLGSDATVARAASAASSHGLGGF
ncbi:MAG: hypothetical protein IPG96_10630 [Proteobacteria bacterium]|nr:hypothetical protein [Pseudomonadota bacterium]